MAGNFLFTTAIKATPNRKASIWWKKENTEEKQEKKNERLRTASRIPIDSQVFRKKSPWECQIHSRKTWFISFQWGLGTEKGGKSKALCVVNKIQTSHGNNLNIFDIFIPDIT